MATQGKRQNTVGSRVVELNPKRRHFSKENLTENSAALVGDLSVYRSINVLFSVHIRFQWDWNLNEKTELNCSSSPGKPHRSVKQTESFHLMLCCLYFSREFDWKSLLQASSPVVLDSTRWLDAVNIPFIWIYISSFDLLRLLLPIECVLLIAVSSRLKVGLWFDILFVYSFVEFAIIIVCFIITWLKHSVWNGLVWDVHYYQFSCLVRLVFFMPNQEVGGAHVLLVKLVKGDRKSVV